LETGNWVFKTAIEYWDLRCQILQEAAAMEATTKYKQKN
jgi:hypothetical protein